MSVQSTSDPLKQDSVEPFVLLLQEQVCPLQFLRVGRRPLVLALYCDMGECLVHLVLSVHHGLLQRLFLRLECPDLLLKFTYPLHLPPKSIHLLLQRTLPIFQIIYIPLISFYLAFSHLLLLTPIRSLTQLVLPLQLLYLPLIKTRYICLPLPQLLAESLAESLLMSEQFRLQTLILVLQSHHLSLVVATASPVRR